MNMLNFEFSYPFYLKPNGHAVYTSIEVWQELEKEDSEFSFTAVVAGFHVYRSVWLPHLGQRLNTNTATLKIRFCAVREHRVTLELTRMSTIDL